MKTGNWTGRTPSEDRVDSNSYWSAEVPTCGVCSVGHSGAFLVRRWLGLELSSGLSWIAALFIPVIGDHFRYNIYEPLCIFLPKYLSWRHIGGSGAL
jgi:hypothetical protein